MGGLFNKTFWFKASLYMFLIFWKFRGSFWVLFLVFENFEIVVWIRIPTFGGVCFIKLFDLRPPYICFWFFGTLGGLFEFNFWFLKILKLYFKSKFQLLRGSVLWNFLIWGFLDGFIHSSGIIFLVPFLATKETLAPLANDPIM